MMTFETRRIRFRDSNKIIKNNKRRRTLACGNKHKGTGTSDSSKQVKLRIERAAHKIET